ncbi:MAG: GNAT family N-acetyltransferase [Lachnospiraceae bacterium]|nr:GNAT family N-acetyltransferase [Lachnospiraceae bacterium]
MKHCGTKQIETNRLILRRFKRDDVTAMYENWASDPEVTKYLTWPTHTSTEVTKMVLEDWINSYEKEDYYQWAIVPKDNNDTPIGSISIVEMKEKIGLVHVGYCIGRNWWHQGITSEAMAALIDFCFEELEVNRVEARHDPNNPNSGAVMKKCGMIYEGTLRKCDHNNQGICDVCYYGILRSEWEQKNKQ